MVMVGIGVSPCISQVIDSPLTTVNTETASWLAETTVLPSQAYVDAIDGWWTAIKTANIQSKILLAYSIAAPTGHSADSLINLVNPSLYKATLVGSPTFNGPLGWTGGTGKAINTGVSSSTLGVSLNNYFFGSYATTNTAENTADCGTSTSYLNARRVDSTCLAAIQTTLNRTTTATTPTSIGFTAVDRSNGTNYIVYKNGVALETLARASVSVGTESIYILARNVSNAPASESVRGIGMFVCGTTMTAPQHLSLSNANAALMAAIATIG